MAASEERGDTQQRYLMVTYGVRRRTRGAESRQSCRHNRCFRLKTMPADGLIQGHVLLGRSQSTFTPGMRWLLGQEEERS